MNEGDPTGRLAGKTALVTAEAFDVLVNCASALTTGQIHVIDGGWSNT